MREALIQSMFAFSLEIVCKESHDEAVHTISYESKFYMYE